MPNSSSQTFHFFNSPSSTLSSSSSSLRSSASASSASASSASSSSSSSSSAPLCFQTYTTPHYQDRLRSRIGKARRKQVRRTNSSHVINQSNSSSSPSNPPTHIELRSSFDQVQLVRVKELRSAPILQNLSDLHPTFPLSLVSPPSLPSQTFHLESLPNEVLERIFEFLPDKYFFPATFRSRHSIYGFAPPIEDDPVASLPAHARNESEGWTWHTPPMQYRLVNRRWAAIAAQVFLRHLSLTTLPRLKSLGALFDSAPSLASCVRSLALALPFQPSQPAEELRRLFRQLLSPLSSLRALSLRALSPGLLFPAPLTVDGLFIPSSIVRFAIEFSDFSTSSLVAALTPASAHGDLALRPKVTLHAAELNLFLVSLPHLRSLHLARFTSKSTRPLARYFSHPAALPKNRLRSLTLSECRLLDSDWHFLGHRFGPGLRHLKVDETVVGSASAASVSLGGLAELFKGCGSRLESLDLCIRNWEPALELRRREAERADEEWRRDPSPRKNRPRAPPSKMGVDRLEKAGGSTEDEEASGELATLVDRLLPRLSALRLLRVSGGLMSSAGLARLPTDLKWLRLEHLGSMGIDAKVLTRPRPKGELVEIEVGGRLDGLGGWAPQDLWAFQKSCWDQGARWREVGTGW